MPNDVEYFKPIKVKGFRLKKVEEDEDEQDKELEEN